MDALGDHALACPRSGLLARRAKVGVGPDRPGSCRAHSGPRDKWCPNNGWDTPRHQESRQMTAGGWTCWFTGPRPWASRCAATLPSCRPGRARGSRNHAPPTRMGQRSRCRTTQTGGLPGAHGRPAPAARRVRLGGRGSLEWRGPAIHARHGPHPRMPRAASLDEGDKRS